MLDGIYQSLVCFYITYLLFAPAMPVTDSGQDVSDHERMGVYVASAAIIVVNTYILLNCYRWDWLLLLLVSISILLVYFWTGVYSSFTSSGPFYKSASQVFAQATFWAVTFVTVLIALLPRIFVKVIQKVYFPYDVDLIREQVSQGKFEHLENTNGSLVAKSLSSSATSSAITKPSKQHPIIDDDQRPIYPPSVAPTATTHNPRSQNGSDGTDYTRHQVSIDPSFEAYEQAPRTSIDRARPSFDRMRASMDRIRPSYEAAGDFTSAAMLTRLESSQSFGPIRSRTQVIIENLQE